jgi:hypothetical protein
MWTIWWFEAADVRGLILRDNVVFDLRTENGLLVFIVVERPSKAYLKPHSGQSPMYYKAQPGYPIPGGLFAKGDHQDSNYTEPSSHFSLFQYYRVESILTAQIPSLSISNPDRILPFPKLYSEMRDAMKYYLPNPRDRVS